MADPAPPARPRSGNLTTLLMLGVAFFIMFNEGMRTTLGRYAGYALDPAIGFGGRYPVLTILIAGAVLVAGTTVVRHFTTDWIETARTQAYMRHFQREMMQARKDNNTYKLKKLTDAQPEIMKRSQEMQGKQLKSMPVTMIVAIPLFAWLTTFLVRLDYTWFSAPWNPAVDMFGSDGVVPWFGRTTSVFPHWVLLYIALSIPLGSLIQRAMKYFAWKERWQKRHGGSS